MPNVFEIIRSPWESTFLRLLNEAEARVYLASPFIKTQTASLIVKNIHPSVDFRYINSFKLAHFHRGASDLEALRILEREHCKQKSIQSLHAKLFVFDKAAIVTSGNLTPGGLRNNIEYGVLIQGDMVEQVRLDYLDIFNHPDNPEITPSIIEKAEAILRSVPRERQPGIKVSEKELFEGIADDDNIVGKFDGGPDSILRNLSPWEKDVFASLLRLDTDVFTLKDIYFFEGHLSRLHPRNRNVRAKIRQQLQFLRDVGLIQFVKPGVYKKLWI